MLNLNLSDNEMVEMQCIIDRKNKGYFTMNDLITSILSEYEFKEDNEDVLLKAL